MTIFDALAMVGGLALFLYGMHIMGEGLSKASGGKLEKILEKLTSSPLKAVLLGAGVTALIQSSSATTVMVVGFVNSGIMKLQQAVGIIMGANIGTTATAWILSLSGLEGDNFWVQMLKPDSFSPILAMIGAGFIVFTKKEKLSDIGKILIGFAILMTGMSGMSDAVKPLRDVPEFTSMLTMFSSPILGMAAGAILTAIIQSSSASVGILQALCATGSVGYSTAIPIIMGQNIGTCVTAMISSIGASKNAKRTALVHLYFNLIGTIVFMVVFYVAHSVVNFAFMDHAADAAGIATVHSIFNVFATCLLLPFSKVLVKLATLTVKDDKKEKGPDEFALLDERFLDTTGLAMDHCRQVAGQMAELAKESMLTALDLFDNFSEENARKVEELETRVDHYEDKLGTYLMKLTTKDLTEKESEDMTMILHSIGNFERISDHACNLVDSARELHGRGINFSEKARLELQIFTDAVREIVVNTIEAYQDQDISKALLVEPLEEAIDDINMELKARHVRRLTAGKCTIELGFVHSDIITSYERIADHCSNIAACMIEVRQDEYDIHDYLDVMKREDNAEFRRQYKSYKDKYLLP